MSRTTDTAEEMGNSLRIDLTSGKSRKTTVATACEILDENKTAATLDACKFLAKYVGRNALETGEGRLEELLRTAEEKGSLTAPEIAAILDTEELPVNAEVSWSIGSKVD